MDPRWQKVLLLQTSYLGDTVLTLPLVSEVKRRFPHTHLTVLCSAIARELLQDHPEIDELIVDDKRRADRGLAGLWRKARVLRQNGYTMALTPHKSLRSALLLYLARIPFRVGFRQSKGWFLFNARAERKPERHDVERNLSVLEAVGIPIEECRRELALPIAANARDAANRLLESAGIRSGDLVFGMNPGSVWPTKRWPAASFAETARALKRKHDCRIVLFGGPEDMSTVGEIERLAEGAAVNLAGKIELRDLAAVLSACTVLITNDSGPMHIAVAAGVSTVAIFCATTPSLGFYPYASNAVVLEKDLPCRPCAAHGGRRCPLGTEACMRAINPENVVEAVEHLLQGGHDGVRGGAENFSPAFVSV
jgi:lipopolysaccharide heptosyltransferase II